MIRKESIFYESRDGDTKIHAIKWLPDKRTPVRAILIFSHGMSEYIGRYDEFARYLASMGIVMAGNDHLGHGESIRIKGRYGYFCHVSGDVVLLRDVHRLKTIIEGEYPGVPVFVMGYNLGSYLVRNYISDYGNGIKGAIIMGTGQPPKIVMLMKIVMTELFAIAMSWKARSRWLYPWDNMNNKINNPISRYAYLTKVDRFVKDYDRDPLCGFMLTVNAINVLVKIILKSRKKSTIKKIPKNLNIFVLSGKEDPIGHYGKYPENVVKEYKKYGINNVDLKLYEGDRHAILFETDMYQVYEDIYNWISERL